MNKKIKVLSKKLPKNKISWIVLYYFYVYEKPSNKVSRHVIEN